MCWKWAVACVRRWFEVIITRPVFDTYDAYLREVVLIHEVAHIYFNRARKKDSDYEEIWKMVSEFDLDIVLRINEILGTNYKKNAWVSNYAKTNHKEDFAECRRIPFMRKAKGRHEPYGDWRDIKILIADNICEQFKSNTFDTK